MKQLNTELICSNLSPNNCGGGFDFGVVWVWVCWGFFSFLKLEIIAMIMPFGFLIQIIDVPLSSLFVVFVAYVPLLQLCLENASYF